MLSNSKLFADDTFIYIFRINAMKIIKNFWVSIPVENVIVSKQAQEVNHRVVFFNNRPINRKSSQKHLRLFLDEKLNFSENLIFHKFHKFKKVLRVSIYYEN